MPLGSSWPTLTRVSLPAPPASGPVPPDRWCTWALPGFTLGPLTSWESSCDSSPRRIPRVLVAVLLLGNLAQKRHWVKHLRWGSMAFPAAGRGWRWLTRPLAHRSAGRVLLPTSGLWGPGHRPVLQALTATAVGAGRLPRSEYVTSWNVLAELCTAFRKHCAAARRTSEVPEPRRGAPQLSPSLYGSPRAWEAPGPPQQGVGEDAGPWGGSRGQRWRPSPRLSPAAARGAGGGWAPGAARREASSAERGALAWGGQGRRGCRRRLPVPGVSATSWSPVRTWDKWRAGLWGRDAGKGPPRPAGVAGCWPWPAGGWWRGVDGSAPPAPLCGVPSCFRGWHQAPFRHPPMRQPPPWLRAGAGPGLSLHGDVLSIDCVPGAQDAWAEDTRVGDRPRTGGETGARQAGPPHLTAGGLPAALTELTESEVAEALCPSTAVATCHVLSSHMRLVAGVLVLVENYHS